MSAPLFPITWQLHSPAEGDRNAEVWLAELWEMRGRVLNHVWGLPEFKLGDGSFADPDPVDQRAYHLLARSPKELVGCIRAVPLTAGHGFVGESLLGRQGVDNLLLSIGATRERTAELSRWFVLPEYADSGVAIRLVGGIWAVLRWLGTQKAIGMVATRDGQDRILMRMGCQRPPHLAPIVSPRFGETIVALWLDILGGPSRLGATLMDEMAAKLKLAQLPLEEYCS
jgi:hypothetical protein